jgi:hypothetical protein
MKIVIRIFKFVSVSLLVTLFTGTGCASAKKSSFYFKKAESLCDLSRLGRNKYYYSANYQRKLAHNTKKIAGH